MEGDDVTIPNLSYKALIGRLLPPTDGNSVIPDPSESLQVTCEERDMENQCRADHLQQPNYPHTEKTITNE